MKSHISKILFFYLSLFFISFNALAVDRETVDQVSRITGIEHTRMSKIVELSDTLASARQYSREKKYKEAISEVMKITPEFGFTLDDGQQAQVTLFSIHMRAGRYEEALKLAKELVQKRWLVDDCYNEANALFIYQNTGNKKIIDKFINEYYQKNKINYLQELRSSYRLVPI